MITSMVVQLPRTCSAWSFSPFPRRMEARGAPPILTRAAKAEMHRISGMVTPTPVRAVAPTSGMWPMYIRSTKLYSRLISWARMEGRASWNSSRRTGSFPRSAPLWVWASDKTKDFLSLANEGGLEEQAARLS